MTITTEEWVKNNCLYITEIGDRFYVCLKTSEAKVGDGLIVADVGYREAAEVNKNEFARVISMIIKEKENMI